MEYKYKYLHICAPSTRMLKSYIMMLQDKFDLSEHYFLCRVQSTGGDGFTSITGNIINFNDLGKGKIRKYFALSKIFKESKNIVIHGFVFNVPWIIFLYLHRSHLKRAIWIIWGIDLYNFIRTSGNKLKNKILNHIEYQCRYACKTSIAVFPTDVSVFKKCFGETKEVMMVPLVFNNVVFQEYDELININKSSRLQNENKTINIMVGHNAYPFNRHGEVLLLLERFKYKNIFITLPLSYGNDFVNAKENYVESLQHLIKNLSMEEKTRVLTKLIPKTRYNKFLANIDIAILNANRQNALGNIVALLYMGKKVYLAKDNPLFNFFSEKGFEIHDVQEIASSSFDEFVEPIKTPFPHPWIKFFYSIETAAPRWKIVFDYNDGKLTQKEAEAHLAELIEAQEKEMYRQLAMMRKIAQGEQFLKEKAYSKAFEIFDRAAQGGNMEAICKVGTYLIAEDDAEAAAKGLKYLETAANAGNAGAIFKLGQAYEYGKCVTRDIQKAHELYSRAAEMGNAQAMGRAGIYLCLGICGFEKNPQKGIALLHRAADGHDSFAVGWNLAHNKKQKEALPHYETSARDNDSIAAYYAGMYLIYGYGGIEKNVTKGIEYITTAAECNNELALVKLAQMYESGEFVVHNEKKAMELYSRAAQGGNMEAICKVGTYLIAEDDAEAAAKGLKYLETAANAGNAGAIFKLGQAYEYGKCVTRDIQKAHELYSRAAEMGNAQAMGRAGIYLCLGICGFEKNPQKGIALLKESAENGNVESIAILADIYNNPDYAIYISQNELNAILGDKIDCLKTRAASADDADSLLCLANLYKKGIGVEKDNTIAVCLYQKAAEQGSTDAMNFMGMYLLNCRQDDPDETAKGWMYLEKAAKEGHPLALANIAMAYENGFYVKQDIKKALQYYEEASSRGNMSAKRQAFKIKNNCLY